MKVIRQINRVNVWSFSPPLGPPLAPSSKHDYFVLLSQIREEGQACTYLLFRGKQKDGRDISKPDVFAPPASSFSASQTKDARIPYAKYCHVCIQPV